MVANAIGLGDQNQRIGQEIRQSIVSADCQNLCYEIMTFKCPAGRDLLLKLSSLIPPDIDVMLMEGLVSAD
jgi:hypothetical protein